METFIFENDIRVFCVTAKSFPDGIMEAFEKLHASVSLGDRGRQFGISRPNPKGQIVYKAALEEINDGDAERFGCEPFVIQKGSYIFLDRLNFMKDLQSIGKAFHELISQPGVDPNGYCLEWYLNQNDVRCMVRLDDNKK
jgi:hypothetical protein